MPIDLPPDYEAFKAEVTSWNGEDDPGGYEVAAWSGANRAATKTRGAARPAGLHPESRLTARADPR